MRKRVDTTQKPGPSRTTRNATSTTTNKKKRKKVVKEDQGEDDTLTRQDLEDISHSQSKQQDVWEETRHILEEQDREYAQALMEDMMREERERKEEEEREQEEQRRLREQDETSLPDPPSPTPSSLAPSTPPLSPRSLRLKRLAHFEPASCRSQDHRETPTKSDPPTTPLQRVPPPSEHNLNKRVDTKESKVQCSGLTKKGERCKRMVGGGKVVCRLHDH